MEEVNRTAGSAAQISWGFLTPLDVVPRLVSFGVPRGFDALKVDIDSFDADLLAIVLAAFKPKLVMVEINPDWPPPVRWHVTYDPAFPFGGPTAAAGFYGASADAMYAIASSHGYAMAAI